jgi:dCTP deaminase
MAEVATTLFASSGETAEPESSRTGVLPYQAIRQAVREGVICGAPDILPDQLQPASIDLRLGPVAFRVRASFLPGGGRSVREKLDQFRMHEIDLSRGAVLERGCVYIVQLVEWLRLPSRMSALANPKSSTGRLDIFTRLISDRAAAFDRVEPGYQGPLYAEIAPRTFSILVREGSRLNQLRLRRGSPASSGAALRNLQSAEKLVTAAGDVPVTIIEDRIGVTLDLECAELGLTGWRAKKHTDIIDIDRRAHYEVEDFWEPIRANPKYGLILDPDDFYILSTREFVKVPRDWAAEMVAYDTMVGEFRVHYAGFFDPGFGEGAGNESKAVLEVRSHEVPFLLEHGQLVGWLRYERLTQSPDRAYGEGIGSSYQRQGLALAKQFKLPS